MSVTTFDTLKFVKKLKEAGISEKQAEVQAEVLAEHGRVKVTTKSVIPAKAGIQNLLTGLDSHFRGNDNLFKSCIILNC